MVIWHRIRAGYYAATASAMVGSRQRPVTLYVRHIPEWPPGMQWAVEAHLADDLTTELIRADDGPLGTKRKAVEAAESAIESGWERGKFGWTLKSP